MKRATKQKPHEKVREITLEKLKAVEACCEDEACPPYFREYIHHLLGAMRVALATDEAAWLLEPTNVALKLVMVANMPTPQRDSLEPLSAAE